MVTSMFLLHMLLDKSTTPLGLALILFSAFCGFIKQSPLMTRLWDILVLNVVSTNTLSSSTDSSSSQHCNGRTGVWTRRKWVICSWCIKWRRFNDRDSLCSSDSPCFQIRLMLWALIILKAWRDSTGALNPHNLAVWKWRKESFSTNTLHLS